jgi:hypothetical protein
MELIYCIHCLIIGVLWVQLSSKHNGTSDQILWKFTDACKLCYSDTLGT